MNQTIQAINLKIQNKNKMTTINDCTCKHAIQTRLRLEKVVKLNAITEEGYLKAIMSECPCSKDKNNLPELTKY